MYKPIGRWLFVMAGLVALMVVIGGLTRLTNSGLSMVEWRPVTGWLPPLSHEAWLTEFEKYKLYPEYQKINLGMDLLGFQEIYWFEYVHRLLGRLIGVAFVLPLIWFWLKGRIPGGMHPHLLAMLILGGAQGGVGWFMVASGLVDHPDVSHYRLTMHLGLAFAIFAYLLWGGLSMLRGGQMQSPKGGGLAILFAALVYLQVLSGGLVAGLNAGFAHNTWPLMDGQLIPNGLGIMQPAWLNIFENALTVQFQHRMLAYTVALFAIFIWWRYAGRVPNGARHMLLAMVLLQVCLGIATLLMEVPVGLGALHQFGALLVFAGAIMLWHGKARRARS